MAEEKRSNEGEFQFVQEKIKQSGSRRGKLWKKASLTVFLGVVFGVVACITFVLLYPWAQEKFGEEPVKEINIPKDEELAEEEEDVIREEISEGENEEAPKEDEKPDESQNSSGQEHIEEENADPDKEETPGETGEQTEEEPQPEPVIVTKELELADYGRLFELMRGVGKEAMKSMVMVTAARSDIDWFYVQQEDTRQVSGLLIEDNGVEQLILTNFSDIEGAETLKVTFADGATASAVLKKYDRVTNLAVIGVNLADMSETTLSQVKEVTWGNSNLIRGSEPVIAIGRPVGIQGSMVFGSVTAVTFDVPIVDGEYQLLLTDIDRRSNGNGALVNFNGEIVGWIQDSYFHSDNTQFLTAYGISDLKRVIEHLCNNQDIPYLGVTGMNLTKEMKAELGFSTGIYIAGIEMDSPAMAAGMQSGDILVDISGQKVRSVEEMHDLLLNFSSEQMITIKVMRRGKEELKEISYEVSLTSLK